MAFKLEGMGFFHTFLPDGYISFHIRRSAHTYARTPRNVVAFRETPYWMRLVPGVMERADKALVRELKRIQNWNLVRKHGFDLQQAFYSLLWRFKGEAEHLRPYLSGADMLAASDARRVERALRRHRTAVAHRLRAGRVFRIPDTEVTFGDPHRSGKEYARSVLVLHSDPAQVVFIPFSTRTDRMDRSLDILFHPGGGAGNLGPDAAPAVDTFPYPFITKRCALLITASQPMGREAFLAGALSHVGSVRVELLRAVQERMKKGWATP